MLFGLDISHHQDERLDLARAKREGISYIILKATEGSTWNDPEFAGNLAEARRAGLLVAAYHYQRPGSAAAQIANIRDSVPLDVALVFDVEGGSGSVALTRDLVRRARAAGYRVPLLYLPRWYWQQIGSPSLEGLPPLWSSRYPDMVVGSLADEWADVPAHYWSGYGGLRVELLQFTSSAAIAGFHPIDANAYRGTRAQLAALFNQQEDDMELFDRFDEKVVTKRPGTYAHSVLNIKQNASAARRAVEAVRAELGGLRAAIAALSKDGTLDEATVERIINDAVAEHSPSAPEVAEALGADWLPLVSDAVRAALGEDNTDQAEAIVAELGRVLAAMDEGTEPEGADA